MSGGKKTVLFGAAGTLAVGGVLAFALSVHFQRKEAERREAEKRAYIAEALELVAHAEKAHAAGRFEEATKIAKEALEKQRAQEAWFDGTLKERDAFWRAQLALWKEAEKATDRKELGRLADQAKASRPLADKIAPLLTAALERERTAAIASIRGQIPLAQKAYEAGNRIVFRERVKSIRKTIEGLPEASREAVQRESKPDEVFAIEARLAEIDAIVKASGDDARRADKLREIAKKTDGPLRDEILGHIETIDKETRPPVRGYALPDEVVDEFVRHGLKVVPSSGGMQVLRGPEHRYLLRLIGERVLIETDRVRLLFPIELIDNREGLAIETANALATGIRATGHERALAEEPWIVAADAPGRCAYTTKGEQAWIFLDGRLYEGRASSDQGDGKVFSRFRAAARALAEAVNGSAVVPAEIKGPMTAFLRVTTGAVEPGDDLLPDFCRQAVYAGYVEAQLPKSDEAVTEKLKAYREAYDELTLWRRRMEAKAADGARVEWRTNIEGQTCWRLHDGKTTTFAIAPRDTMHTSLVVHTVFAGEHETWPESPEPVRVRMFHRAAGEVAVWEPGRGLVFDAARWTKAVRTDARREKVDHFGQVEWWLPPHALTVDARGRPRTMMLPGGTLVPVAFNGAQRREAQDKFLESCGKLLTTPGELHLFYRYFVEYVHDSPVTTATTLIGSGKHSGDMHQDAYQTLDRFVMGRYLADCDDLAEFYQVVLKRQGRLAYVLSVPGHATCGVAEKKGNEWVFFCVDTGPPRQLSGPDLDVTLEKVIRTYDDDGGMKFDPRQVHFLFRFAGEQTRSEYLLDSRMFRDAAYADLMIRVQEYWHFHFYALGIETMSKVLETDKMPANCAELAGLLIRVGLFDEAIKWTETGIQQLGASDVLSRLNETVRKAECHRQAKREAESVKALKAAVAELEEYLRAKPNEADRFLRVKFEIATNLAEAGDPWSGWQLVANDARRMRSDVLAGFLTHIYGKMKKQPQPSAEQTREMNAMGDVLARHFSTGLFNGRESFNEIMRNYTSLMYYYEARDGAKAAFDQLVKREYPQGRRRHTVRKGEEEIDWAWIRMSPWVYWRATDAALDKKDKDAAGPKAAVDILKALDDAWVETRKHGSLGTAGFVVLEMRLLRGCLEMDEAVIKGVFDEMKRQSWGELYEDLARRLGRAAQHMSVADFEKVFRLFCSYEVPRRHYYGVVYTAFQSEAVAHAAAASKICIEKFPGDADMKREHELLMKLAK